MMPRSLVLVFALAVPQPAWAFPVCNVNTAGGLATCMKDVDAGGEIVILPGLEVEVGEFVFDKDVTLRCQDPAQTYTLVHKPRVDGLDPDPENLNCSRTIM